MTLGFVAGATALSAAALVSLGVARLRGGGREGLATAKSVGARRRGASLVVVHAKWCGYCTALLKKGGVWDEVVRRLPGVRVSAVDEARSPSVVRDLGVRSFPSIHAVDAKGRSVARFEGDRSPDAIVDFALRHVAPMA